jgi:ATP-dependent DNA helicase RecQ
MRTKLEEMIAFTEVAGCRTQSLLGCFGEDLSQPCGHCDNCAAPPRMTDATVEAQKVLSAVYRTGQVFGALHIISVLRGEATEGVLRHAHDRLPTYGVGGDHPPPYWRGLIRQLIAHGALDVDTGGHGGLFLVEEKARPILRGEGHIMLREDTRRRLEVVRPERAPVTVTTVGPEADIAFDALRTWRSGEARAQRIPPYVIFHDTVLREIAAVRPTCIEELGQIKGVGASKLQRYGSAVLAVMAEPQSQ